MKRLIPLWLMVTACGRLELFTDPGEPCLGDEDDDWVLAIATGVYVDSCYQQVRVADCVTSRGDDPIVVVAEVGVYDLNNGRDCSSGPGATRYTLECEIAESDVGLDVQYGGRIYAWADLDPCFR